MYKIKLSENNLIVIFLTKGDKSIVKEFKMEIKNIYGAIKMFSGYLTE
jgi:hypothetical protein